MGHRQEAVRPSGELTQVLPKLQVTLEQGSCAPMGCGDCGVRRSLTQAVPTPYLPPAGTHHRAHAAAGGCGAAGYTAHAAAHTRCYRWMHLSHTRVPPQPGRRGEGTHMTHGPAAQCWARRPRQSHTVLLGRLGCEEGSISGQGPPAVPKWLGCSRRGLGLPCSPPQLGLGRIQLQLANIYRHRLHTGN